MLTQFEKAKKFKSLHTKGNFFILPNPWDIGSAKILSGLGYDALATTSAGLANALGKSDYEITRSDVLTHISQISQACDLPISADLENGFGDTPEVCAEMIKLGANAGLVGGSIEDFTRDTQKPQYEIDLAKDRIIAAVEAANSLPYAFTLTARAENFFTGTPNLDDTITRLQTYQEAGAHVLFAPGLKTLEDIKTVIASIDRPLNVLLGPLYGFVPMDTLKDIGVTRVSLGPVLVNSAYSALIKSATEVQSQGSLSFLQDTKSNQEISQFMQQNPV